MKFDLCAVGIAEASQETWARLYRSVSQTLQRWPGDSPESYAAQRLFAFIDDDFGRTILEPAVRARLREASLQQRIVS